jgi:hypothetical protein
MSRNAIFGYIASNTMMTNGLNGIVFAFQARLIVRVQVVVVFADWFAFGWFSGSITLETDPRRPERTSEQG